MSLKCVKRGAPSTFFLRILATPLHESLTGVMYLFYLYS